ncbi:hypothetical protein NEOLEDRAFT_1132868 [Neolentinus lepideus HHB14362 ss-1]|uniref:Uncharacterized protein n=1 Tax=Neolentinus lepideus HHB14362 ss-1 TaxID=1314782 RepID=A0A165SYS3_9AGAM|nr:hypothetical protein NEOLEDRAFT_1132868 [Neolentinus lepideus HHB14362 ss-1]
MPRAKRTKLSPYVARPSKESTRKTRSSTCQGDADMDEQAHVPLATPDLAEDDEPEDRFQSSTFDNVQSAASSSKLRDEVLALVDDEETPAAAKPKLTAYGSGGYDALKSFNGQMYSGMAIGGSHTWNYDQSVWNETKEEPDLWKIDYQTKKRRARNAPKGSGAPVGTEYHWLIVAHQHVKKIDANTYETHLSGSKYKLAHKNVNSSSWSVPTVKGQREREILLLEDAKRRVEGLPPVLANEKVKVRKGADGKGQMTLDGLFGNAGKGLVKQSASNRKRKREKDTGEEEH